MDAKTVAAALVSLTLVGVAACGDDSQSPVLPSPVAPLLTPIAPPLTPAVTSLTISGKTSSAGVGGWRGASLGMVPGETARLTATATFSDGTEWDEFSAFPNPVLTLNIIWQNRSFHFDINQNFPIGAVQPDPSSLGYVPRYWDLGLLGAVGQLDPENGILTTLTGPDGAVYDGLPLPTANTTQDPQFAIGYFNGNEGSVAVEDRQTPLQAAAALDEGGNFIDIRFSPLTLDGNYDSPAAVGANGSIGVLTTSDGSGGGSGGGWGCFISTASSAG